VSMAHVVPEHRFLPGYITYTAHVLFLNIYNNCIYLLKRPANLQDYGFLTNGKVLPSKIVKLVFLMNNYILVITTLPCPVLFPAVLVVFEPEL